MNCETRCCLGRCPRDGSKIDIKRIDEAPVGWLVRAHARPVAREKMMQRIDAGRDCALTRSRLAIGGERRKIAERGSRAVPQSVEMRGEAEHPFARCDLGGQIG